MCSAYQRPDVPVWSAAAARRRKRLAPAGLVVELLRGLEAQAAYSGFPKLMGTLSGRPYNKDHSILGPVVAPLNFGNSHLGTLFCLAVWARASYLVHDGYASV